MNTHQSLPIDVAQPDASTSTELAPIDRAILALKSSDTERELQALATKHADLVEVKDKVDRAQVHGAAMELMRARTSIKARADEVRDDAKKFNAAVIAEEKRLTAMVEPEEKRLKGLRDDWDAEQERIKKEAEEKERARVLALGARIQEIRGFAKLAGECRSSEAVRRLVDRLAGLDMTGFAEFEAEAVSVFTETRQQVDSTLNARLATEAEAARLKAEREELARQQAEAKRQADALAAQQKAEADRLAAERAELERMRAEIEAAKAPAPAIESALMDAITTGTGWLTVSSAGVQHIQPAETLRQHGEAEEVPDADLVDTATEAAEVGIGFDMAMSMPVPRRSAQPVDDTPPAQSLIDCIATAYGVDAETACRWLCARADDFLELTAPEPIAA